MKNLIIIPARKGSKRIKNKNLVKILNKPLIKWTIDYAKSFEKRKFEIVVVSDCAKIKKICLSENIFFLERPKSISGDFTSMHEVIFYTYRKMNKKYKYIILLQPTSPLRSSKLIYKGINILNKQENFDSLIHLSNENSFTGKIINNVWKPDYNINTRTQDIKNKFVPTGNLFIYRSSLYIKKLRLPKKTYGLTSYDQKWVDIDDYEDILLLEYYLKNEYKKR